MASGITPPKRNSRNGIRDNSPPVASVASPSPTPDRSGIDEGSSDDAAHVKVCVRVRPFLRDERETNESYAWTWENNTITQEASTSTRKSYMGKKDEHPPSSFAFDNLFYPEHTNVDVYSTAVRSAVSQAMLGYHASIFAYGQTSSGKTHTMNGTVKLPGVIPQAIYDCFEMIHEFQDREFLFRVSYLEIYNETVNDLLNPGLTQIKIQHDPKQGTTLVGVKEQIVMNPAQVIALLQSGEAYRHVGATDMNDKSSRAHTLFKLIIESKLVATSSAAKVSTLNLIDLAGSENAKMTNSKGERAREAKFINQSLLTLSTIIHRLSENRNKTHLPYRDSKLTRILQAPLSGNAYIVIICTISPTLRCQDESLNTLKFASRAKKIKVDAKVNEVSDDKTLLRQYRQEIEALKAKLAEMETLVVSAAEETNKEEEVDDADAGKNEEHQQMMLQMIEHMERLILKGEMRKQSDASHRNDGVLRSHPEGAKKPPTPSSATPRLVDGFKSPRGRSLSIIANARSSTPTHSSPNHISAIENKSPPSPPPDDSHSEAPSSPATSPNTQKRSQFLYMKKASDVEGKPDDEQLAMRNTIQSRIALFQRRKSTSIHFSEEKKTDDDSHSDSSKTTEQDFFTVPNNCGHTATQDLSAKPLERRMSVDSAAGLPRPRSGSNEFTMPNASRHSPVPQEGDVVLMGVTEMLLALKQHVATSSARPPQLPKRRETNGTSNGGKNTMQKLLRDLKRKEEDNIYLQDEIVKLAEDIEQKDKMLAMLTEGLKEVEINQNQMVSTNDYLVGQLELCQERYHEIVVENKMLREDVMRLTSALMAREKQLFEITGRKAVEEEF